MREIAREIIRVMDKRRVGVTISGGGGTTGGLTKFIDVKNYGAVGDGVTDDAGAIQAAINEGSATNPDDIWTGGVVVLFPPGRYLVGSQLRLASPGVVKLLGAGREVAQLICPGSLGYLFAIAQWHSYDIGTAVFESIGFAANSTGSVSLLRMESGRGLIVRDCRFDSGNVAIEVMGGGFADGVTIENCVFSGQAEAAIRFNTSISWYFEPFRVSNCHFFTATTPGSYAILYNPNTLNSYLEGLQILDSVFTMSTKPAVRITAVTWELTMRGNTFWGNGLDVLASNYGEFSHNRFFVRELSNAYDSAYYHLAARIKGGYHNEIVGNHFQGVAGYENPIAFVYLGSTDVYALTGATWSEDETNPNRSEHNVVANNHMQAAPDGAITIHNMSHTLVTGNQIRCASGMVDGVLWPAHTAIRVMTSTGTTTGYAYDNRILHNSIANADRAVAIEDGYCQNTRVYANTAVGCVLKTHDMGAGTVTAPGADGWF